MSSFLHRAVEALDVLRGKPTDTALGFPGIQSDGQGKRRPITVRTKHELYELPAYRRQAASATVRDQKRAFNVLAWMIRKHLSNVSRFTPHVDTGDDAVDAAMRKCLAWHALPENFDALGRLSRDEWMYQFEGVKTISGDAGGVKCKGLKMQGIEGDRIGVGQGVTMSSGYAWFDGRWVSEDGLVFEGSTDPRADIQTIQFGNKIVGYAICRRTGIRGSMLTLERIVPAQNFIFDAYWPERFDSNRGTSPILPILNECADVMESREFLVLKIKVGAIFGFGFKRVGEDEIANRLTTGNWLGNNTLTVPGETDPTTTEKQNYAAQIGRGIAAKGPLVIDMDPGDELTEVESKTPNSEIVPFLREITRSILLALDMPFTMYDSMASSFSANEQARNEFDQACAWKRDKNEAVLRRIYSPEFVLGGMFALDQFGLGKAMSAAQMDLENLAAGLDWYPSGRPQPTTDEIKAGILGFASGVDSPQRFCARHAVDQNEIRKELSKSIKEAEKDGVPLFWASGGQASIQQIMNTPDATVAAPKVKE